MKDLIKKILKEETEEVLAIPSLSFFPDGIEGLKNFIEKKNITRWSFDDDLDLFEYKGDLIWLEGLVSVSGYLILEGTKIKSLDNLQSVGLYLDLGQTQIKSLGNLQSVNGYLDIRRTQIKSLGNLQSVGGNLYLSDTQIKSLGNLQSVGSSLWLNKFLSEKYTDEEIRSMINVGGTILRP
jgi:hypothetical protein